ncbi:MAG: cytosine permease, partial [Myxococcales bacterium]
GGERLVGAVVAVAMVLCFAIVVRGVHVLNVFNKFVTPGLIAVAALLFYGIFSRHDWPTLAAAAPLEPAEGSLLNYAIAFEYGLGAGFAWWPGIGFLTRNTDNQRNSLYPQLLTYGLLMGIVCCTGLFAALLFRSYDPTEWMLQVGGPFFGVAALALVAVANLSASALMIYVAALGLKHVPGLRSVSWPMLVGISLLPVLGYVLYPQVLYDKGGTFLAYNATIFAPISGVMLVDYLLLRKQRINVSQVFEEHPSGQYWFHGGFNWLALGSVAAGQALYLVLFDPVSNDAHPLFQYLTASGPAVVLPIVLYWVGAKLLLVKRAGGYEAPPSFAPIRQPNL